MSSVCVVSTMRDPCEGALVREIDLSVFHVWATWVKESAAVVIHGSGGGT